MTYARMIQAYVLTLIISLIPLLKVNKFHVLMFVSQ